MNLSDYFSCGFFLIKANKPDWIQRQTELSELFPPKLLSLSECICPRFSLFWGWHPGNQQAAFKFGISESQWEELVQWCNVIHDTDVDVPGVFLTLRAAQQFARRFNLDADEIFLVEVGLDRHLETSNWREDSDQTNYGVDKRVAQRLSMTAGGTPLGFEVASHSFGDLGHSWLCNPIPQEIFKLYGIRPGQFGLIQSREEARKVYEWIAEDWMRAEPEPYDYYALVQHPLLPPSA